MSFLSSSIFFVASILLQQSLSAPVTSPSINPLLPDNFPDPAILLHGDTAYTYSTNYADHSINVPVATAPISGGVTKIALDAHGKQIDALQHLPAWASKSASVWAPDVIKLPGPDGAFILYYAASAAAGPGRHCVGAAKSSNPLGPFIPMDSKTPFICDLAAGGAIDPTGYVADDGKVYVAWKVDGNSLGGNGPCGNDNGKFATPLQLQEVDPKDGFTKIGSPVTLLDRIASDGPYIEAPSLAKSADGTFALFFSSHCYRGPDYDVNYATASNIKGPYHRADKPLLASGDMGLFSPGGARATRDGTRIVFHADKRHADASVRQMYTSEIAIQKGVVTLVQGKGSTTL